MNAARPVRAMRAQTTPERLAVMEEKLDKHIEDQAIFNRGLLDRLDSLAEGQRAGASDRADIKRDIASVKSDIAEMKPHTKTVADAKVTWGVVKWLIAAGGTVAGVWITAKAYFQAPPH